MNGLLRRTISLGKSPRGGVLALALGVLATFIWVQIQGRATVTSGSQICGSENQLSSVHPKTGIELRATLSQPMVTLGGDGTVYLDLTLLAPETLGSPQVPTDTIVVLDRSGSMGDDNKWRYATQAVYSLLDRLTPVDRIALITPGQKVCYVADIAYSPANLAKLIEFVKDADHLFIEAAFLDEHRDIAREKFHLTAAQAGTIAGLARVKQFTIFHFSPRYTDQESLLQEEARRAYEEVLE